MSEKIILWDWTTSHGNATDEQMRKAYNALSNNGKVSDFSSVVWNDIVDFTQQILDGFTTSWYSDEQFLTKEETYISDSNKTLTAKKFNTLMRQFEPYQWSWWRYPQKAYYIPETRYFYGISDTEQIPDKVFGAYFLELLRIANFYADAINEDETITRRLKGDHSFKLVHGAKLSTNSLTYKYLKYSNGNIIFNTNSKGKYVTLKHATNKLNYPISVLCGGGLKSIYLTHVKSSFNANIIYSSNLLNMKLQHIGAHNTLCKVINRGANLESAVMLLLKSHAQVEYQYSSKLVSRDIEHLKRSNLDIIATVDNANAYSMKLARLSSQVPTILIDAKNNKALSLGLLNLKAKNYKIIYNNISKLKALSFVKLPSKYINIGITIDKKNLHTLTYKPAKTSNIYSIYIDEKKLHALTYCKLTGPNIKVIHNEDNNLHTLKRIELSSNALNTVIKYNRVNLALIKYLKIKGNMTCPVITDRSKLNFITHNKLSGSEFGKVNIVNANAHPFSKKLLTADIFSTIKAQATTLDYRKFAHLTAQNFYKYYTSGSAKLLQRIPLKYSKKSIVFNTHKGTLIAKPFSFTELKAIGTTSILNYKGVMNTRPLNIFVGLSETIYNTEGKLSKNSTNITIYYGSKDDIIEEIPTDLPSVEMTPSEFKANGLHKQIPLEFEHAVIAYPKEVGDLVWIYTNDEIAWNLLEDPEEGFYKTEVDGYYIYQQAVPCFWMDVTFHFLFEKPL